MGKSVRECNQYPANSSKRQTCIVGFLLNFEDMGLQLGIVVYPSGLFVQLMEPWVRTV